MRIFSQASYSQQAIEQGVDICTLGVTSEVDADSLQAVVSGCGYSYVENFDLVATQFQTIFGYVRDFYRLSFAPGAIPVDNKILLQVSLAGEVTIDFTTP